MPRRPWPSPRPPPPPVRCGLLLLEYCLRRKPSSDFHCHPLCARDRRGLQVHGNWHSRSPLCWQLSKNFSETKSPLSFRWELQGTSEGAQNEQQSKEFAPVFDAVLGLAGGRRKLNVVHLGPGLKTVPRGVALCASPAFRCPIHTGTALP